METIAEKVILRLSTLAIKELQTLINFQDDLDNMKLRVSAIKAVLRDAERKANHNETIRGWLENLKDVLYDADDLLDAYFAEELARELMTRDKMAKEVRIFFSNTNRIACAFKLGQKMKGIRKKLDGISSVMNNLPLSREQSPSNISDEIKEWRQTFSFVSEEDVVGREEEKKLLVSYLLESHHTSNNNDGDYDDVSHGDHISVIPIVGIGGLGKTTLAQLVYNDEAVQKHFDLKIWVCVSEEFTIRHIGQAIIGHAPSTTSSDVEKVAQDLRNKIEGKLFLLVLDDVWNEDRERWLKLKTLLVGGLKGSKIIVTTRSEKVAEIMGTHPSLSLKDLEFGKSWKLFCRVAFKEAKEPNNPELVSIGKDIVKKCVGVPLAIRTIGSLLFTRKLEVDEWKHFRDNELSNIDSQENRIFSILKVSYDHLPSYLKNCFTYCAVFPKDFKIERKMLIQLWVAQGFIKSDNERSRCAEEVGEEYFMKLLSRCFFQEVEFGKFGEIKKFKMHDLMHDLARFVTKNEYFIVKSESIREEEFGDRVRHVSSEYDDDWKFPTFSAKAKKVRTILSPHGFCEIVPSYYLSPFFLTLYDSISCSATPLFPKRLRVLDLSDTDIKEIPRSIGGLKHLRYLDLTGNKEIQKLPRGMAKLHNLQTLKLNGCEKLKALPREINKMVSLKHVELDDCDSLTCMPSGVGDLVHLHTLTNFVLGNKKKGSARISELFGLNLLRGKLVISRLERQRNYTEEVKSLKLLVEKSSLGKLHFHWSNVAAEGDEDIEEVAYKDEMILEALEPHESVKSLHILQFCGKRIPEWIGKLTSLDMLYLEHCSTLASLPETMGNLTSLQKLQIEGCSALSSLPESIGNLTSLKVLQLEGCTALRSLPDSMTNLTSLLILLLRNCLALEYLPELRNLKRLSIINCPLLTEN